MRVAVDLLDSCALIGISLLPHTFTIYVLFFYINFEFERGKGEANDYTKSKV